MSAVVAALIVDRVLLNRYSDYSRLLTQHECDPLPCSVDVDNDGASEKIAVRPYSRSVAVYDAGRELLRLPYDTTDRTLRTHIGIRKSAEGMRILVYDGTKGPDQRVSAVYGWDGQGLTRVAASKSDVLILSAMSANDDTGTFQSWMLYKSLRLPFILILLLGMAITWYKLYVRPLRSARA